MVDRLSEIDLAKYLEDSLSFTDKEKLLTKEFSEWLPQEVVDCHTHSNLREHVQEVDEEMFHQMISTFEGFNLEDSRRVELAFFGGKTLKRLRFPFPFRGIDIKAANEYLSRNVKNPDKVALCGIPNDIEYTISMLQTGRFSALKMYHQQFNPPSKQIYEYFPPKILNVAENENVPIILHLPQVITLCKDQILRLVEEFPNLRISLAHLGLANLPVPNLRETYDELSKYSNIYLDTSMIPSEEVVTLALKAFGDKRVMYGSDEPLNLIRSVIYNNPGLGQRIVTEYMYHWVNKDEHERYKHLASGASHAHWPPLIAIKKSIEALYLENQQSRVKNNILCNNAKGLFSFK